MADVPYHESLAFPLSMAQEKALLAIAKYGSRVIGSRRVYVTTADVLRRAGLIRPAGENESYYTGVWELTPAGETRVRDLISGMAPALLHDLSRAERREIGRIAQW